MSCRVFIFVLCLALGSMLAVPALACDVPVEDFEAYRYDDPPIWMVWIDGFGDPDNGSLVGYWFPPFAELTIVHGGDTSMPFFYDNDWKISWATKTLTSGNDWTVNGVTRLSLWFKGDPENAAEPMYVALNGNAAVYHDDPDVTQIDTWTEWVMSLQAFADKGVDLANVNSITIGFGDPDNPQPGGFGKMYFDDICLLSINTVGIDIKPGSFPNAININGNGVIPVAILGSAGFDVSQINISTLEFGGLAVRVKGNGKPQCSIEDVSGDFSGGLEGAADGFDDLVCQFADDPLLWVPGDNEATLTGELLDGTPFEGTDSIKVVQ
jgi:hypothetical protein